MMHLWCDCVPLAHMHLTQSKHIMVHVIHLFVIAIVLLLSLIILSNQTNTSHELSLLQHQTQGMSVQAVP